MCGIAGICLCDGAGLPENAAESVDAMCRAMRHRGPDGQGVWSSDGVCLGHRRLSIIDLAGGAQPMHSADGRYHVTFNGETGLTVPPNDPEALADAIQWFMEHPDEARRIGRQGQELVRKMFDPETNSRSLAELFSMHHARREA